MSGEAEVLDVGARAPTSRRRRLLVLGVLLAVAVGALLLDAERRSSEAAAVAECRRGATAALQGAAGPLWAHAALVRPALAYAGDEVRQDLYGLLSTRAAAAERRLAGARRACDGSVLWYHRTIRERRDACLADLDAQLAWYGEVAKDGRAAFGPSPSPGGCG